MLYLRLQELKNRALSWISLCSYTVSKELYNNIGKTCSDYCSDYYCKRVFFKKFPIPLNCNVSSYETQDMYLTSSCFILPLRQFSMKFKLQVYEFDVNVTRLFTESRACWTACKLCLTGAIKTLINLRLNLLYCSINRCIHEKVCSVYLAH